jgi:hypothetical protein
MSCMQARRASWAVVIRRASAEGTHVVVGEFADNLERLLVRWVRQHAVPHHPHAGSQTDCSALMHKLSPVHERDAEQLERSGVRGLLEARDPARG